ncbi:hypothetical protein B9T31_04185 [Acinetobacter sp. ANC 4558]|uniref:hypothetical protein n=1 Tax=Acinetobacter sp. ANC 4558 TaxID=1977876 RepID=UPI000A34DF3A|nr:hypothetical protein [Acinetobacter sp. ANC 4558]OTG87703.1 hypothetical protein B9T31_04185 [Acinetobacter sp. ANC 4558]
MPVKDSRLIVEINGEVVFSQFDIEGQTGGVNTLDYDVLSQVKTLLENAIGFIDLCPIHRSEKAPL